MSRKGLNIYKRKDGRWEARYIKSRNALGKPKYGYLYASSYREVRCDLQHTLQLQGKPSGSEERTRNSTFELVSMEWLDAFSINFKESTYIRYRTLIECYLIPRRISCIGIIEKAKLFPYLLSMGDLRHPCDSCYRCEQFIKCLSEYCTDCKSQAKKLWEKYHTTEDIIQDAMMNQKSLRIWVRNTSECWCGIYYICFCAAKRHSANISLASTEDLKKVLEFKGDQISEKTLSSEDIAEYAQKWEKLLRENKPLQRHIGDRKIV